MEEYVQLKVLGHGSFGSAVLVQSKLTNEFFVIKQVQQNNLIHKNALNEVRVLQECCKNGHPFLVKFVHAFIDATSNTLCMVMDYYENGDLFSLLQKQSKFLNEDTIMTYFVQLLLALKHLHDHNVLHRDLKTQNIFVSNNGSLRIGDFGISRFLSKDAEMAQTTLGTPYYLAPEICEGQPYNSKCDVYALGCVLYQMCCLRHPFTASNMKKFLATVLDGKFKPIPSHYSEFLKHLVSKLLSRCENRPNINEILLLPLIRDIIKNKFKSHLLPLEYQQIPKNLNRKNETFMEKSESPFLICERIRIELETEIEMPILFAAYQYLRLKENEKSSLKDFELIKILSLEKLKYVELIQTLIKLEKQCFN